MKPHHLRLLSLSTPLLCQEVLGRRTLLVPVPAPLTQILAPAQVPVRAQVLAPAQAQVLALARAQDHLGPARAQALAQVQDLASALAPDLVLAWGQVWALAPRSWSWSWSWCWAMALVKLVLLLLIVLGFLLML